MTGPFPLPSLSAGRKADPKQYAHLLAHLLAPAAATGYAMAAWRFAADMKWMGEFVISEGLFSRWQIWLAAGIATQAAAHYLARSSRARKSLRNL